MSTKSNKTGDIGLGLVFRETTVDIVTSEQKELRKIRTDILIFKKTSENNPCVILHAFFKLNSLCADCVGVNAPSLSHTSSDTHACEAIYAAIQPTTPDSPNSVKATSRQTPIQYKSESSYPSSTLSIFGAFGMVTRCGSGPSIVNAFLGAIVFHFLIFAPVVIALLLKLLSLSGLIPNGIKLMK